MSSSRTSVAALIAAAIASMSVGGCESARTYLTPEECAVAAAIVDHLSNRVHIGSDFENSGYDFSYTAKALSLPSDIFYVNPAIKTCDWTRMNLEQRISKSDPQIWLTRPALSRDGKQAIAEAFGPWIDPKLGDPNTLQAHSISPHPVAALGNAARTFHYFLLQRTAEGWSIKNSVVTEEQFAAD